MLRVGVIGVGSMGENHARVYASLVDRCKLQGVFDTDSQRACQVAERYGTKSFSTLESLLDHVDAVSIAVPTEFHHQVGTLAMKRHIRVLMEKPIASIASEARNLIQQASKHGVKLQVGHIELYNPIIQVLCSIIANEKIIAVHIQRLSPFEQRWTHVDVVEDLMIHDVYILNALRGGQ